MPSVMTMWMPSSFVRTNGSAAGRIIGRRDVRLLDGQGVKSVWCDSYLFYLKYTGQPSEPGLWDRVVTDFSEAMKKYEGCRMACQLYIAALEQLELESGLHKEA